MERILPAVRDAGLKIIDSGRVPVTEKVPLLKEIEEGGRLAVVPAAFTPNNCVIDVGPRQIKSLNGESVEVVQVKRASGTRFVSIRQLLQQLQYRQSTSRSVKS